MPEFSFEAFDIVNNVRYGVIRADNRDEAIGNLVAEGLIVGSLREGTTHVSFAQGKDSRSKGGQSDAKSLERLLDEWARLMQIGLNIDQALTISCAGHGSSSAGHLASEVRKKLREGKSLARALEAAVPGRPTAFIACIEAGEKSSQLAEMLASLARRSKAGRAFSAELRSSLAYPCFVLATTTILIGILIYVVLPSIGDVLTTSEAKLPWTTQAMLDGAAFVRQYGIVLAGVLATMIGALFFLSRLKQVRQVMETILLKLPLIGQILFCIEISSYIYSLSVQIQGNVGISKALRLSESALSLSILRRKAAKMEQKVTQGIRISQAAGECFAMAKELPTLIRIGEENGRLADVLAHAGEHYESKARHDLKVVTSLITPLVTILTGAIVGTVVMSLMSALLGLNDLAFR